MSLPGMARINRCPRQPALWAVGLSKGAGGGCLPELRRQAGRVRLIKGPLVLWVPSKEQKKRFVGGFAKIK